MQIPFVAGSYTARSKVLDSQACINLYPEKDESGSGKNVAALIGCPGTNLLVTLPGSGGIRGEHAPTTGSSIIVRGNQVYRLTNTFTYTNVGELFSLTGPVSIADNGTVAVIVDGPYGYVINLFTSEFNRITDPAFYGSDVVTYLDGYFIFNRIGTQQFYISSIDGTDFDALDFSSAEGSPDNIVSLIADHRELWIFGQNSIEIFVNTGNADFPFERNGNAFIEQGCIGPFAVAKIDNTLFWIGTNDNGGGIVWRANGYVPNRISTHAVEFAIQGYGDISDCITYSYQQEGHSFIVFTFPTANKTWCYDVATSLWHERAYRDPLTGRLGRHRSNCCMYYADKHIVGDFENGNLYALDLDYFSDNGDPMPAIRAASPVFDQDYKLMLFHWLQIDMETGVGTSTGQGENPQAVLQYSNDGGQNWSNEYFRDIGKIGETKNRVRWTNLGSGKDRVFRIIITDPVKRVIIGAALHGTVTV